jgi:hypothetical protein
MSYSRSRNCFGKQRRSVHEGFVFTAGDGGASGAEAEAANDSPTKIASSGVIIEREVSQ